MKSMLFPAFRLFCVLTILTGAAYPLVVTGIAQAVFPHQANGSVLKSATLQSATSNPAQNQAIGSELLAQKFDSVIYFQSRPSACDYGTVASGASNKAPTSAELQKAVNERRLAFRTANRLASAQDIPAEMAFASGSGLDPHISPEAARMQIARVATARKLNATQTQELVGLVERAVESRQFGVFGEPRVNVLQLNCAMDEAF